jgi:hypothetical protein
MYSFCFEGVHSLELNEVLYFGDSGFYVVQGFFNGTEEDLFIDMSAALRKDSVCCQLC